MQSIDNLYLENIVIQVDKYATGVGIPFVLVLELAHFSAQSTAEELLWARQNIIFGEKLCSLLVKRFKRKIRIQPCIVINDLAVSFSENNLNIPEDLIQIINNNIFLTLKKFCLISERNLRNIASKRLANLVTQVETSTVLDANFDRLFFEEASAILGESCPAIGNINLDNGHVVPRCTSILAALHEKAAALACKRLHSCKEVDILLLSFAQNQHDYIHTVSGSKLFLGPWPTPKLLKNSLGKFETIVVLWSPNEYCGTSSIE